MKRHQRVMLMVLVLLVVCAFPRPARAYIGPGAGLSAIGAFLAVDPSPVSAAATALAYFGLAGETAGEGADAPGSFMVKLIDALYTITPQQLQAGSKIETG